MNRQLSFCSWNVRGLGQTTRRDDVLAELISTRPTFVALQETKLQSLEVHKPSSFLPCRLRSCVARDAIGASGGMLTAWDQQVCSLINTGCRPFMLTTKFKLASDASEFTLTNVYAPVRRDEKQAFFTELVSVAATICGAWIVIGDFNLTRDPADKNNDNFNFAEANNFNDLINSLCLIEIPLADRAYTWSNNWADPTLVRLDRCFVNVEWDAIFPNTTLSSLTRFCSDHVPLLLTACTRIPRGSCFRFENSWLVRHDFRSVILAALSQPTHSEVAKGFILKLKHCRGACRSWAKRLPPLEQRATDIRILIKALDLLEEQRSLHPDELRLRRAAVQGLQDTHAESLAFWRQRFSSRLAVEWDENSRFFHVVVSGRRRRNDIAALVSESGTVTTHSAKSAILHNFYLELLGRSRDVSWSFAL